MKFRRSVVRLDGEFTASVRKSPASWVSGVFSVRARCSADVSVTLRIGDEVHSYTGRDFEQLLPPIRSKPVSIEVKGPATTGVVEVVR